MHYYIPEIHQNPAGCIHAFNPADQAAGFVNDFAYFGGNCLHLGVGVTVTDDEIITDRRYAAQIQSNDVHRFLVFDRFQGQLQQLA
ncbi:hypothetical protein D3C80_1137650 [compost metagenome]